MECAMFEITNRFGLAGMERARGRVDTTGGVDNMAE